MYGPVPYDFKSFLVDSVTGMAHCAMGIGKALTIEFSGVIKVDQQATVKPSYRCKDRRRVRIV